MPNIIDIQQFPYIWFKYPGNLDELRFSNKLELDSDRKLLPNIGPNLLDRPRKNGIETANVGIRDNPNAAKTAGVPVRAILFEVSEEADEETDNDGKDTIPVAGNSCKETVPELSLAVIAAGFSRKFDDCDWFKSWLPYHRKLVLLTLFLMGYFQLRSDSRVSVVC